MLVAGILHHKFVDAGRERRRELVPKVLVNRAHCRLRVSHQVVEINIAEATATLLLVGDVHTSRPLLLLEPTPRDCEAAELRRKTVRGDARKFALVRK